MFLGKDMLDLMPRCRAFQMNEAILATIAGPRSDSAAHLARRPHESALLLLEGACLEHSDDVLETLESIEF